MTYSPFFHVLNNPDGFKVLRCPQDDESQPPTWQEMRKGVCDLHRRCQVSGQANARYADAIACTQVQQTLEAVAKDACNRVTHDGRRYRGLHPWDEQDMRVLRFLAQGQWAINGFRNRDLRAWLFPGRTTASPPEIKRLSGQVTRWLRLLRAHGLIRKVPCVNRYVLTDHGRTLASALLSASAVEVQRLVEMAA